jgi:hypothetical protein
MSSFRAVQRFEALSQLRHASIARVDALSQLRNTSLERLFPVF